MSFRQNAWAKIWEITPNEKSTKVRLSTSKKNKQTGDYEQDFSGFATLAGTAHRDAAKLKVGDRIKIGECEVTNRYDKSKNITYTNYSIYTFEFGEDQNNAAPTASSDTAATPVDEPESEEELPF